VVYVDRRAKFRNGVALLLAVVATALICSSVGLSFVERDVIAVDGLVANARPSATATPVTQTLSNTLTTTVGDALRPIATAPLPDGTPPDTAGFEAALTTAAANAVSSPTWIAQWDAGWRATGTTTQALIDAPRTQPAVAGSSVTVDATPLAVGMRDQIAASGFPEVGGVDVGTASLVIATNLSPTDAQPFLRFAQDYWWLPLLLGIVVAALAYWASTRRWRLTLFLGADLVAGAGALWLLAVLGGRVIDDRGLDPVSVELLPTVYAPFGASLTTMAALTAAIGGLLVLLGLLGLTLRRPAQPRVASTTYAYDQ
jgi:hypothetical protein